MGYFLNFVTIQLMFKAAQTFVDRHQLNQCGPLVNQVLESTANLTKNVSNLRHQAECNRTGNN